MIDYEFYETPAPFTRWLFNRQPIAGRIFEPCAGNDAIVRAAQAAGEWVTNDLDPRWSRAATHLDATQSACWTDQEIDWAVSNPPFTPALSIITRAIAQSRVGVAMHLRASIHEVLKTGERRTWMADHRPTGILWLPRFAYQRSPSTGKWTTDSVCACWVIWLKDPAAPQFIDYAPVWVLDELERETGKYRFAMDVLMGFTGSEAARQKQAIALAESRKAVA